MSLFGHVFSPSFLALIFLWIAGVATAVYFEVRDLTLPRRRP